MSSQLQNAIAAAQALSADEQLQLFQVLTVLLQRSQTLESQDQDFRSGHSIEALIAVQQPPIVENLNSLSAEWAEESIDDFLTFLQEQRQAERIVP